MGKLANKSKAKSAQKKAGLLCFIIYTTENKLGVLHQT